MKRPVTADPAALVIEAAEGRRDGYVARLAGLVRAGAEGEAAVQAAVATWMRELGCSVESFRYRPEELHTEYELGDRALVAPGERICVMGRRPGAGEGRSLLCFAHPDSEPVADVERWTRPPFAAVEEGGRLYGWGVADDLLGVATMLAALDAVLAAGLDPLGELVLGSTPSKSRAQGVIAALNRGYLGDGCVYLHPAESGAGLGEIKAFASGLLRFRVTVEGRPPLTSEPGHTAFYHLAVDPLEKALLVRAALVRLAEERAARVRHPALEAAVGRSTNLHFGHIGYGEAGRLSRVPERCVLGGSITFPPGEAMRAVQAEVEAAIAAAAAADPWLREHPPALEWLMGTEGAEVPQEHPLYQAVSKAIGAVTGATPHVNPLHSASDIRNPLLHRGIPTVGFGSLAGDLTHSGGHDEWVDLDDFQRAVQALGLTIVDWCGVR
jgi:acetylornithine deacetylase